MLGALDPQDGRQSRLSAGSSTSLISTDSGYSSMAAESESPTSPKAGPRRSFGGIAAFFRRKGKSIAIVDEQHTIEASTIPVPIIEEPIPESLTM